jgi:beta-glucosidase
MVTFPDGFLWGVATAAHQVEGANVSSDAWLMEHLPGSMYREPSGDAVDFYHRYPDDIAVVATLGLNAFRFGVEWARIEPEAGEISRAQLEHYSRVVDTCLGHGVEPIVTLHHFTSPQWLIRWHGGWRSHDTADRFADYAATVMSRLGDRVSWVCTINEANTPLLLAHYGLLSAKPHNANSLAAKAFGVADNDFCPFFPTASDERAIEVVGRAHRLAVDSVHAAASGAQAGITLSLQDVAAEPGGEEAADYQDEIINRRFLRDMGSVGDFVGVQTYTRLTYGSDGRLKVPAGDVSDNGLELVPSALTATCRQAFDITGLPRTRSVIWHRRSPKVWTCVATCTGRWSTTSSGSTAITVISGCSATTGPRSGVGSAPAPNATARLPARTRLTKKANRRSGNAAGWALSFPRSARPAAT